MAPPWGNGWPDQPEIATEFKCLGATYRGLHSVVYEDGEQPDFELDSEADYLEQISHRNSFVVDITEAGWPMRSMAGETWWEMHGLPKPFTAQRGYLNVFGFDSPNRVIWSGMLLNEVFFVAGLAAAVCGWVFGRRWMRRRRGCCLVCGYDLRGDLARGCSECGWRRGEAVPPSHGVAR